MSTKRKAAIFQDYPLEDGDVFGGGRRERIAAHVDLYPHDLDAGNFDAHAAALADVEVVFATWGMPKLTPEQLARMPRLEAVFYAAGNVRAFAQPLLDSGIVLVSAWQANAIPVAEMCLSQTLLSLRGYFRAVRRYREAGEPGEAKRFHRPGALDEVVGIIGMGKIGTLFREKLAGYRLRVIAHDPFLTAERAAELDVEPVALDEVFRRAYVVSNHIPDLPDTRGVLRGEHFRSMREGATFINTGRGAQVAEEAMIEVLESRPDLTALLDVTWPEPPAPDSRLWTLPNVVISPHVGGTIGNEVERTCELAIEEYERWAAGQALRYQVTPEVFATMG